MAPTSSYQKGIWSEYLAALYLTLKGYRVLKLRYRSRAGEVDIIARKGKTLVFVEVKARGDIESALFAVSPKSQQRIQKTAQIYLQKHDWGVYNQIRFDIIVIRPWLWPSHLPNAFQEL